MCKRICLSLSLLAAATIFCFALRPNDPPRPPAPSAEECAKKLAKVKQMHDNPSP